MGSQDDDIALSKLMSFALRHRPDSLGLALDKNGWVAVEKLVAALNGKGMSASRDDIERVVAASDKKRFALSEDGALIRANQGHSIAVDLELTPQPPPPLLYHGTVMRFMDGIRRVGLVSRSRQHVHLSETRETALAVGRRRGAPVVLEIDAEGCRAAGATFYRSANGVWLTAFVESRFISFPQT